MRITPQLTDEVILEELGERLTRARLGQNLTQSVLAEQAGVSKRTVERLESGSAATQLSGFLRICRTLKLLANLEAIVPEAITGPMEQLKMHNRKRLRATGKRTTPITPGKWSWGNKS